MARNLQRLSNLVGSFGPGAMLDLPTRSVLVGGLERWEMRQGAFKPIEEPRLARMIERMMQATGRFEEGRSLLLRTPPLAADVFNREPQGVVVTVFPTWFVCAAEQTDVGGREIRRRRLVRWSDLDPAGGRRRYVLDDGKKVEVTPIRFVAGCEKGHLQDIDWRWVVHGEASCRERMWLVETGPAQILAIRASNAIAETLCRWSRLSSEGASATAAASARGSATVTRQIVTGFSGF